MSGKRQRLNLQLKTMLQMLEYQKEQVCAFLYLVVENGVNTYMQPKIQSGADLY